MNRPVDGEQVRLAETEIDPAIERLSRAARQVADRGGAQPPPPARWGRLQAERARRSKRARLRAVGAAVALPLLVAGVWGSHRSMPGAPAVSYQIEGSAAVVEGAYIHDVSARGARLRFSEGTAIALEAGARAWVESRGPHGARLRLESGRAHFDVVHREKAAWSVDAGPFTVEVTGTAFAVAWTGAAEELEVDLQRGSVIVRGPLLPPSGTVLRPGQRLLAHIHDNRIQIDSAPAVVGAPATTPAPSPDTSAVGAPAADTLPPLVARPAPEPSRAHVDRKKGAGGATRPISEGATAGAVWGRRVAAGDFKGVLADAERAGLDQCPAICPLDALTALADAARYAGRGELARRLLLAARERFPGTPPARAAAFLLGRMSDHAGEDAVAVAVAGLTAGARSAAATAAINWYDQYLRESPDGAYAPEATARMMLVVESAGDHAAARRLAQDYLRRYPAGAYAPQAVALLRRRM